jgi:hypothetical protein
MVLGQQHKAGLGGGWVHSLRRNASLLPVDNLCSPRAFTGTFTATFTAS